MLPSNGYFEVLSRSGDGTFFPTSISGDGTVVSGNSEIIGAWTWTRSAGIQSLEQVSSRYGLLADSLNFSGTAIAGRSNLNDPEMGVFLWTRRDGVVKLPHLPLGDRAYAPISISDDGKKVYFLCYNDSMPLTPCRGITSSHYDTISGEFLWSKITGYVQMPSDLNNNFKDIFLPQQTRYRFVINLKTRVFGLLKPSGVFVQFDSPSENFDPESDNILTSGDGSYVAAQSIVDHKVYIWKDTGRNFEQISSIPNCTYFLMKAIDATGVLFGDASCGNSNGDLDGIRVSKFGVQTIGTWLTSNGIENNLGLESSRIILVSDDGKTIVGQGNFEPLILMSKKQRLALNNPNLSATVQTRTVSGYFFAAHVP